jgi:hypothetical protein
MASAGQRSRLGTLGILWLNYSGVMLPCSGRHQGISATLVFSGSMASIELRSKLEPQKRIPGRSLGEPMNSMPAASKEPLAADFRIETFSRASDACCVYFGRGQTILIERERIKRQTIVNRRLMLRRQAA